MKYMDRRVTGILSKHRKGFGFVIPENKEDTDGKDIYIAPDDMKNAMNQDLVSVRLQKPKDQSGSLEGIIDKILTRASSEVVGTFSSRRGYGFIIPENRKLGEEVIILKKDFNGVKEGDKVVVKITRWPSKNRGAEGKITEIISRKGEPGGDIKALIRAYKLKKEFPDRVEREASSIDKKISEEDISGRKDLRNKTIFTIDGADAKDLDDAVSIEKLPNGNYLLGVHIADVSHYVKEGKALDLEALKRGTSIYLIDQVVPMLPKSLSNGICSLNPGEDRLTLSATMEINKEGRVVSYDIYESIIRSCERLVYTDVSDLLEKKDPNILKRYDTIVDDLLLMEELASVLKEKRQQRGSLDFDIGEAYITLNDEGIPVSVDTAERRVANRMIEEFMLIANETIAENFFYLDLPFVYRVHEKPSSQKIEEFKHFLRSVGLNLKGNSDNIHPKSLSELLEKVEGSEIEHVINTLMLRSMKKAFYGTQCMGHFGLGVQFYCHFTSPIRRYPDLIIHRIIKESLHGTIYGSRVKILKRKTEEAAESSSVTERKAEELEREVEKLKKAEYMSYHLGEEYDGLISGVINFGFYVVIKNTIEGMVRVETLDDDYYIYDADGYRLIGEHKRRTFSLGDAVRIRVESVNLYNREINFKLIQ